MKFYHACVALSRITTWHSMTAAHTYDAWRGPGVPQLFWVGVRRRSSVNNKRIM